MYISQVSGERLQDHWSSGLSIVAMLLQYFDFYKTNASIFKNFLMILKPIQMFLRTKGLAKIS